MIDRFWIPGIGFGLSSFLTVVMLVTLVVLIVVLLVRRPPTGPAAAPVAGPTLAAPTIAGQTIPGSAAGPGGAPPVAHFQAMAAHATGTQQETVRQLEKVTQELTEIRTRLAAIERILRDVE